MPVPNRDGVPIKTNQADSQYVLNYSFDEVYKLLMVGLTAYNPATNSYDRVQTGTDGAIVTRSGNFPSDATITTVINGNTITQSDGTSTYTATINGNTITEEWS